MHTLHVTEVDMLTLLEPLNDCMHACLEDTRAASFTTHGLHVV